MPYLDIHPDTATRLDLREGDWAWIETPVTDDRVRMPVRLTRTVGPDVVHAPSHWWFPELEGPEHGCFQSSINLVLTNDGPYLGPGFFFGKMAMVLSQFNSGMPCNMRVVTGMIAIVRFEIN